jgi:tripartite-type tricarboxylate transporter receptor subunit TctC
MNLKLPRRTFLHLAIGAAGLPVLPRIASAFDYPTRPVHIIVGFPPGGSVDFHARLIAQLLSQRLSQPFIVENRPGAGGTLGTEAVVRAAPDGYTLLLTVIPDAMVPSGMRLEFGSAVSSNMRLSFQAARSIG